LGGGFVKNLILVISSGLLLAFVAFSTGQKAPELVSWPESVPATVFLVDVRVLDVVTGELGDSADVLIESGIITGIHAAGQAMIELPSGALRIEGGGATLLPGLIDMHGHVSSSTGPAWEFTAPPTPELNLRSYAYSGVTTVFDPGDASGDEAFARRARVASGEMIGPRIFTAGPIVTIAGGHPVAMVDALVPSWLRWLVPEMARLVPDDVRTAQVVDEIALGGSDAIKIVVDRIPLESKRMSRERATAVVERARSHGLRTVAHIGTTEDAIDAASAGIALWVHGVYKERIPEDKIAELVAFGIPMVVTSEVFDSYGRSRGGPVQATRLERETVPQSLLDSFYPLPEDFDLGPLASWVELMEETRETRQINVSRLHDAGITILAGSDVQSGVFPGPSLHRELHNLVDSGLSPLEAIRAATLYPARYLEEDEDPTFGVIGVGKRADLILVEGDPTRDVGVLENLNVVLLKGVPIMRTPVAR
jgi:imidazolonepropionase-like amidohydrolase